MITIPRSMARLVRAGFRRALGVTSRVVPAVLIEAGPQGLVFKSRHDVAAVEYRVPGEYPSETLAIPFDLLQDCEGTKDLPVQLELRSKGTIEARWQEGSIPQVKLYEPRKPADVLKNFPVVPEQLEANQGRLLAALQHATETTNQTAIRYATNMIQLQGGTGSVVATDGRQLLVQRGFKFPWTEDLLVPASRVFGSKELAGAETVYIGRHEGWVSLRVGDWTFHLAVDSVSRYPKVEDHLPKPGEAQSRLQLSAGDAAFLEQAVDRLPSDDEFHLPVTVDLNSQVVVRARSLDQPRVTELVLAGSKNTGAPVTFNTDRRYLARAIRLGFQEVLLYDPEKAMLCHEAESSYVWMPLDPKDAIQAGEDPIRIQSSSQEAVTVPHHPKQQRNPTTMARRKATDNGQAPTHEVSTSETNVPVSGTSNGATNGATGPTDSEQAAEGSLIGAAEALRESLRESLSKTGDLIAALKRHRKQSRLVQSTLSSLKQLQTLDA